MKDVLAWTDPFWGNGSIDLPDPEGIAATWFFIKAQSGNTLPGACFPFGMVSASAYSGAYPTGYGLNDFNYHSTPRKKYERYGASGFTHFQQSGTGATGIYYNYVKVIPFQGKIPDPGTIWQLENEVARPGYYSAGLKGTGITAELTVAPKAACHRYTFHRGAEKKIAVDLSCGGLAFNGAETRPSEAKIHLSSPDIAYGYIKMEEIPIYICMEVSFASVTGQIWENGQTLESDQLSIQNPSGRHFGVIFTANGSGCQSISLKLGFSFRGYAQAKANLGMLSRQGFDMTAQETEKQWLKYLDRIQVTGGSGKQKEIFYSSLYHSLIKPCDCNGESPFWQHPDAFFVDFATLWDQYKTQMPLIFSLFPERGRDMVNALLNIRDYCGTFPNAVFLNDQFGMHSEQARCLAHYVLADAYCRKLRGVDWDKALQAMKDDILSPRNRDYLDNGITKPRLTHTLDLAGACFCTALIAKGQGDTPLFHQMMRLSENWKNAYDPDSGLLRAGTYYEGGRWNYSFRLLHNMRDRIRLFRSPEDFVKTMDTFFGYGQLPVTRPSDPERLDYISWGESLNRFEGFNNEPDMETPYAYIYAGRHDRTAEIVRAGMRYMFTSGRGGLPGNNDSGGLSSCYIWNAIGLFPVAGQPIMLIGSPIFDSVTMRLSRAELTVVTEDNSDTSLYIREASFNGRALDRAYLTMDEFLGGGILKLRMSEKPCGWARHEVPPSFTYRKQTEVFLLSKSF